MNIKLSEAAEERIKQAKQFGINNERYNFVYEYVKIMYMNGGRRVEYDYPVDPNSKESLANAKRRRSGRLSCTHPYAVAYDMCKKKYWKEEEFPIIALLHDVIEDTEYTLDDISDLMDLYIERFPERYPDSIQDPKKFKSTIVDSVEILSKKLDMPWDELPDFIDFYVTKKYGSLEIDETQFLARLKFLAIQSDLTKKGMLDKEGAAKLISLYQEKYPEELKESDVEGFKKAFKKYTKISRPSEPEIYYIINNNGESCALRTSLNDIERKYLWRPVYNINDPILKATGMVIDKREYDEKTGDLYLPRKIEIDFEIKDLSDPETAEQKLKDLERFDAKMSIYINRVKESRYARKIKIVDRTHNLVDIDSDEEMEWFEKYIRDTIKHFVNNLTSAEEDEEIKKDLGRAMNLCISTRKVKKMEKLGHKCEIVKYEPPIKCEIVKYEPPIYEGCVEREI